MNAPKLSLLLKKMARFPKQIRDKESLEDATRELQLKMLRIQQGVFHKKERVVIIFEGFDAAGKGGAIRKITELLDPRSVKVIPIGAPTEYEKGKHWLYRFWNGLPSPGCITIFDRSWYGRVLVEKVDKLTAPEKLKRAYDEINEFEAQLQNEGIKVIKIFLAITKDEQLKRFEDRINDPYKQWKITMDDIRARQKWPQYVKAVDEFLAKTHTKNCPWVVIPANSKRMARKEALEAITTKLKFFESWMERAAQKYDKRILMRLLHKC